MTMNHGSNGKHGIAGRSSVLRLAAFGLLLAGCSFTQPQADPTRFYVLTSSAAAGGGLAKGPAVHLRPIELASYIK